MQTGEQDRLAAAIDAALDARTPLPALPDDLTLADGYDLQARLLARREPAGPAGLKAGVTQPGARRHFGLDHALLGRLYGAGRLAPGAVIEAGAGVALECELAIVVDAAGRPQAFGPAIEIVRSAFAADERLTAAKLLAANLAAWQFLSGDLLPWRESFTDTGVTLYHEGACVLEAALADGLGGPVEALPWMLAEAHRRQMPLTAGMVLMTGCCGAAVPAQAGHYRADYGPLGSIEFDVA
ncbi:MAG TPA: hypothetical protein VLA56_11835 [Pseudomonadales bacterium]|nr:hypothetical protein [Pseudomonadales bacterium]